MQHIAGALKKFIKTNGLSRRLDQQKAIDIWGKVVGKHVSKNTEAVSVEHGVLTVKTTTPAWRQELHFQKGQIILNINTKLKKKIIKDIKLI